MKKKTVKQKLRYLVFGVFQLHKQGKNGMKIRRFFSFSLTPRNTFQLFRAAASMNASTSKTKTNSPVNMVFFSLASLHQTTLWNCSLRASISDCMFFFFVINKFVCICAKIVLSQ